MDNAPRREIGSGVRLHIIGARRASSMDKRGPSDASLVAVLPFGMEGCRVHTSPDPLCAAELLVRKAIRSRVAVDICTACIMILRQQMDSRVDRGKPYVLFEELERAKRAPVGPESSPRRCTACTLS